MKKTIISILYLYFLIPVLAQEFVVESPDKNMKVNLTLKDSTLEYNVSYLGKTMLENSPLGLVTNVGDYSRKLVFVEKQERNINEAYVQLKIKKKNVHYQANELVCTFRTPNKATMSVTFRVSNNDIAFKYSLGQFEKTRRCVVERELTGFKFPIYTTTFITPQAPPMSGWSATKPSYEEEYVPDQAMGVPSKYGVGYTFPGLFHLGDNGWVLVSETGVRSLYCGSKLSEGTKDGLYSIAFPEKGENNGMGSEKPAFSLPGETPWRTLTIGDNLKPIVETTVPFDVVEPLYEPSHDYKFGRSTWSWLIWQDASINYNDQKIFVDLSAEMGYEYVLVDGWWDKNIGRDKIVELSAYAKSKNVSLCLWYNSNGYWNDAHQTPKNCMNNSIARKKEMAWMKSIGVKGIKVDFFGGDKQETMKLYEDILSDANDYGLMVIFHGCTLPRGWERMFPNFVGSEAVLASENLYFYQHYDDTEAFNATLHPFIRNTVGSMDFGPVLLNKRHNRTNDKGRIRKTTETFQLATAVLFQTPVQNFAITPNNLTDYPSFVIDFMKNIPTTWDETVYIDGYPGKYVILSRRKANHWFVAGINAGKEAKKIKLSLPMLAGKTVSYYSDNKDRTPKIENAVVSKSGEITVTIQSEGAIIITN